MNGAAGTTTTTVSTPGGTTSSTTTGAAPQLVVVEPPPDTRPKQGLEKAPAEEPIMFRSGLFGVLGSVSDSPVILPAVTVADHAFVGIGASFTWNDNGGTGAGFPGASNPPTPGGQKFFSNLVVAGEYMLIDKLPFALGPELTIQGSLAPDRVFSTITFVPGVAFWYAPFRAPFVLGSALDVQIFTQNGSAALKAVVNLVTPGLRLGYIFN